MKRKNANFGLIVTVDIPKDQKKFEENLFICGFVNTLWQLSF